jgi:PAS domain S-box-containing protein
VRRLRAAEELAIYQEETRQQQAELMAAQQALEESRDRYASLFDYAPVALLSLRRNGIIQDINLHGAELLESSRPRILGLPLLSFIDRAHHKHFHHHMLLCRRQHEAVNTEVVITTRQGRSVPALLSTWTTAAMNRPEYEFRTAITDLSERLRAARREEDYQRRLRSLASELSLAEERERRRIAVEIHDNISQSLAFAKMKLEAACHKPPGPGDRQRLEEVVRLVEGVLAHTRSLTFELSPPVLYELGLEAALEWLGERAAKRYGLEVILEPAGTGPAPSHDVAVLLYQAVRELLVNVGKHAAARRAWVRVRHFPESLHVTVEDDGKGFDAARLTTNTLGVDGHGHGDGDRRAVSSARGGRRAHPHRGGSAPHGRVGHQRTDASRDTGFGLFSIRTRLEHLGGKFEIERRHAGGGRVTMTVPLGLAVTSTDGTTPTSPARASGEASPFIPVTGRESRHESFDRGRSPDRTRRPT